MTHQWSCSSKDASKVGFVGKSYAFLFFRQIDVGVKMSFHTYCLEKKTGFVCIILTKGTIILYDCILTSRLHKLC